MAYQKRLVLLRDEPAEIDCAENDGLGFLPHAKTIAQVINSTSGPLSIAVYGAWGTGKTTLLRTVKKELNAKVVDGEVSPFLTVWFNPWLYEEEDMPLIPLLKSILMELKKAEDQKWDSSLVGELKKFAKLAIAYFAVTGIGAGLPLLTNLIFDTELGISFSPEFSFNKTPENEASNNTQGNEASKKILESPTLFYEHYQALKQRGKNEDRKIVVFIDDLDRCTPQKAFRLIQKLKLIFDLPNFIFVLALDKESLENYIEKHYRDQTNNAPRNIGSLYLEKLIQLSFPIPSSQVRKESFWQNLLNQLSTSKLQESDKSELKRIFNFVYVYGGENPRLTKTLLNEVQIDRYLFSMINGKDEVALHFFAVTRLLRKKWPKVFRLLTRNQALKNKLQEYLNSNPGAKREDLKHLIGENPQIDELLEIPGWTEMWEDEFFRSWILEDEKRRLTLEFYINRSHPEFRELPIMWLECTHGLLEVQVEWAAAIKAGLESYGLEMQSFTQAREVFGAKGQRYVIVLNGSYLGHEDSQMKELYPFAQQFENQADLLCLFILNHRGDPEDEFWKKFQAIPISAGTTPSSQYLIEKICRF